MIHPDTVLQYINSEIGYGVYASKLIAKGTITYVKDMLELSVPGDSELFNDSFYSSILEKYSYIDTNGDYILSWDFGRFVNHSCNPNTLSTGYGFEIAIRDILPGEQITDDYGLFNLEVPMDCCCGEGQCRQVVAGSDFDLLHREWDKKSLDAIMHINIVEQPLLHLLDRKTYNQLLNFINTNEDYLSVRALAHTSIAKRLTRRSG